MRRLAAILALIVAALAGSAHAAPTPVTLEALIADPNLEAFKAVRIDGQIDVCELQCHLCPLTMTRASFDAAKCIDLILDSFEATDPSPNEDNVAWQVRRAMQEAFRESSVTLEAINDPGCSSKTRETDDRGPGDAICSGPALIHARVILVHSRKTGRDALVWDKPLGHLVAAPATESGAMLAAYRPFDLRTEPHEVQAFLALLDDPTLMDEGVTAEGYVCVCDITSCAGQWPPTIDATDGFANPYRCFDSEKRDGRWLIFPP